MALNIGKAEQYQSNPFLRVLTGSPTKVNGTVTKPVGYTRPKGYETIAYEKAPTVKDTVPTKYADGTPFWNDYVTPNKVWIG